jgi:NAD(P)H dehydrogenase (quinone)
MSTVAQDRPILVTGGTGRHGGSGKAVTQFLIAKGHRVRALVRSLDDRAEALKTLGAEIAVGDFMSYDSLLQALDGIRSAYFCYPIGAGIAEAAGLFATAGRKQGLETVVDLSLAATRPDSPSPQGRAQWVAEQIFEWAGFGGTHLRVAAFFMENVALIDGGGIREGARIANAFGDLSLPWIAGADVGALAASLIINPSLASERALYAGGVEWWTYPQITEIVSRVTDRSVRYEELTLQAWHKELLEISAKLYGEPDVRSADHLVAQSVALRTNPIPLIPDHVFQFTGRAPISFESFAETKRKELTVEA